MSDVHVTRHFSPVFGISAQKTGIVYHPDLDQLDQDFPVPRWQQSSNFCDWVSMYQTHGGGLPLINDGAFVRYDGDGCHESTTLKKYKISGSHETGVFIRCDGETVWFEGNVSRFGRADNVFGFDLMHCITRINSLLKSLNLPPFDVGKKMYVNTPNGEKLQWTGARITRLDVTENFQSGSSENAYSFMRFLSTQQASRLKTGTQGEGETVDFGRGSRRVYSKAYLKAPELLRHLAKSSNPQYSQQLADWCSSVGLVRFETTYKSTWLIDNGHQFLGSVDMRQIALDFEDRKSVFTRATVSVDDLSSLDNRTLAVYRMWQAGDDVTRHLSRTRFYVYRAKLLPYGVDIAVKPKVLNFQPKTRVVTLSPVTPPDFYEMPVPSFIRMVA
jgi:hypothetical protein